MPKMTREELIHTLYDIAKKNSHFEKRAFFISKSAQRAINLIAELTDIPATEVAEKVRNDKRSRV